MQGYKYILSKMEEAYRFELYVYTERMDLYWCNTLIVLYD